MSRTLAALALAAGMSLSLAFHAQPPTASPPGPVAGACPAPSAALQVTPAPAVAVARLTLARCVQRDLDQGRWSAAEARLANARQLAWALPDTDRPSWLALVVRLEAARRVDVGPWPALVDTIIPDEGALPWVGPLVRGVAAARSSWAQQDAGLQARGRAEVVRLELLAARAGPVSETERARLIVQAALAGAQYERDEMQLLLEGAHDLEVRLLSGDELRVPVVLAWELEADLLLMTDRYAAAGQRYRDLLGEWPHRVQGRIGLAAAYRRLGQTQEADETLSQARTLWAAADAGALALIR